MLGFYESTLTISDCVIIVILTCAILIHGAHMLVLTDRVDNTVCVSACVYVSAAGETSIVRRVYVCFVRSAFNTSATVFVAFLAFARFLA